MKTILPLAFALFCAPPPLTMRRSVRSAPSMRSAATAPRSAPRDIHLEARRRRQLGHSSTEIEGSEGLAGMVGAEITERTRFRWRDGLPELIESRYDQKVAFKRTGSGTCASTAARRGRGKRREASAERRHVARTCSTATSPCCALAADRARAKDLHVHGRRQAEGRATVSIASAAARTSKRRRQLPSRAHRARPPEEPGRTTTSWLAPELGWVPVKVLQREPDGETMEMRLTKLER
jgi:hypothetical protein